MLTLPASYLSLSAFMPKSLALDPTPAPRDSLSPHLGISASPGPSRSHHLGMSLGWSYMLRQERSTGG